MTWGLVVVRRLVWNMIFYYFDGVYNRTWKDEAMMGSREGLGDRGLRGRAPQTPIQVSFLKILFFVFCISPFTQLIPPPWFYGINVERRRKTFLVFFFIGILHSQVIMIHCCHKLKNIKMKMWFSWVPTWTESYFDYLLLCSMTNTKVKNKNRTQLSARGDELVKIQNHPYLHNLTVSRAQQVPANRHLFYQTRPGSVWKMIGYRITRHFGKSQIPGIP